MVEEASSSEVDAKLRKLDNDLDALRRQYEQYFVGSQDRPPQQKRSQVVRQIRDLEQTRITNTSQRFKFRGLQQRFNSLKQKWNRVEREIEQGTYEPHQQKAQRRKREREQQEAESADGPDPQRDEETDADQSRDDVVELDAEELGDVDLASLEKELEAMDQDGEFEKYVPTEKVSSSDMPPKAESDGPPESRGDARSEAGSEDRPAPSDAASSRGGGQSDDAEPHRPGKDNPFSAKETTRKEKLNKLQDKLGLSNRTSDGSGADRPSSGDNTDSSKDRRHSSDEQKPTKKEKLKAIRDRLRDKDESSEPQGEPDRSFANPHEKPTTERTSRPPPRDHDSSPSRGASGGGDQSASGSRQAEDRSGRDRASREEGAGSSKDAASGSDDDDDGRFRGLYRAFVDAHQSRDETVEVDYESVRGSLERKEARIRQEHGADEVHFQVVRKEGRVYFQPNWD